MIGYNGNYFRPSGMNMTEENGKIWMSLIHRNGICEIDVETRSARICKVFEGESLLKEYLYCHVEKVNSYLIFSPNKAERIAIYDIECDSVQYLPLNALEKECKESQEEAKFWNILRHESDVYLLGYSYPAIIKLNVEDMELTYITDWVEEVEKNIAMGDICGYFSDGHVICDEKALIPVGCMNAVLELDFETDRTRLIKLDVSMKGIGGLSSIDRENVWMVGRGGRTNYVACWNRLTDEIKELFLEDIGEDLLAPFYAPFCTKSKIFLMPFSAFYSYEIDLNTWKAKRSRMLERTVQNPEKALFPWWRTMAPRIRGNILLFLTCDNLEWHEYDVVTAQLTSYFVSIKQDKEAEKRYFDAVYVKCKEGGTVLSEANISLKYFVNELWEIDDTDRKGENRNHLFGGEIYERTCRIEKK